MEKTKKTTPQRQPIALNQNRLKELRKRLNMTRTELASEFSVTPAAIAHWENGVRPIPGPVGRLIEIYESALKNKRLVGKK